MILGIMGPSRSGKVEAAEWFAKSTNLRYNGTTSMVISREVARREGITFEEAHSQRHKRREEWRALGDDMRKDDPAALARKVLIGSNLLVGVRAECEMKQVCKERLCDLVIWIDRPNVPFDPTMGFGPELCDIVIQNHWTLVEYHERLERLAESFGLFFQRRHLFI